jgi:hypothetical protein
MGCIRLFRTHKLGRSFARTTEPSSSARSVKAERFLDHARNLKEVEAAKEELNRELGDF